MKEFGAKLTLQDKMSDSLKKAIATQQKFTQSVDKTKKAMNDLGKTKPTVMVKDKASQQMQKVKAHLNKLKEKIPAPIIEVKDKATATVSKIKEKLKLVGSAVAKPIIDLKDKASGIIGRVKERLKAVGSMVAKPLIAVKDAATKVLGKIGGMLKSLAKGAVIGLTVAGGAGIAAAMSEGASLQQSIGGVETLFKDNADKVKKYADMAYKTAGLSANAYMENVTSFSASLLASLGGDTAKAADVSNMAMIDMADNANKFGTDMDSIQNAYQGFAKQNYTMLDNLKLGYGGTKKEMSRLLADAQKLTGQKYDIENLADVYSAIHAIQENLDVTGTTAKEAASTFSGSFAAMKGAGQNLLGALTTGGDVKGTMQAFVDSAATFIIGNAIPMLGNLFAALPEAIGTAVKSGAPKLKEAGLNIITGLKGTIVAMLPSTMADAFNGIWDSLGNAGSQIAPMISQMMSTVGSTLEAAMPVVQSVIQMLIGQLPNVVSVINSVVQAVAPVIQSLLPVIQNMIPVVSNILSVLFNVITTILPTVGTIISTVITAITPILNTIFDLIQVALPIITDIVNTVGAVIQSLVPVIGSIIQAVVPPVQSIIQALIPVVQMIGSVVQLVLPIISSLVSAAGGVIMAVMPTIGAIFTTVAGVITNAINTIKTIIQALYNFLSPIVGTIQGVLQKLQGVFSSVFNAIAGIVKGAVDTISSVLNGVIGVIDKVASGVGKVTGAIGGAVNKVGSALGFAYGKDRVPYDKYPAILHQGEKVLTRNEADQYDRVMSARGVQIPNRAMGTGVIARDNTLINAHQGEKLLTKQEVQQQSNSNNYTINVNNPVVREDADIDKIVDKMVKRLEKVKDNVA